MALKWFSARCDLDKLAFGTYVGQADVKHDEGGCPVNTPAAGKQDVCDTQSCTRIAPILMIPYVANCLPDSNTHPALHLGPGQ